MKKVITITIIYLLAICFETVAQVQLSDNFNKELMALLKADAKVIKDKEIENQQNIAHIYSSKLKLSGFEVNYVETQFGNELWVKYQKTGSDEVMEALALKFIELPYVKMDSKKDKGVLGKGILDSNLKRRIELLNLESKPILTAELDADNVIFLHFFNH